MSKRKKARHSRNRLLARLVALNFLLFSSPFLSGWLALASGEPGTRMVALCTDEGLRQVAVPTEDLPGAPRSDDHERAGLHCARCSLGKCSGASFVPPSPARVAAIAATVVRGASVADHLPVAVRTVLRPRTRAPPGAC